MTTPPVPQWAVDAGIDFCVQHYMPPDKFPALARIIAAHAPQGQSQGNEDGARLDWLEANKLDVVENRGEWSVLGIKDQPPSISYTIRAAIDAARKKDL